MDGGSWHYTGDRDQDNFHGKEMQKSKMTVWGCFTNSCEKKRKYGLRVIIMCQYSFVDCSKCTTLVGDVDKRGAYTCVRGKSYMEISISSVQFFYKLKFFLIN